jgi:pyridinium-3,5-bisthiocarboxylic acid mononucleotide nickel chelatase
VRTAHGLLPNPAPAVVELLKGAPTYSLDVSHELTTPTGAALLAANSEHWGPMPPLTLRATGFGAGSAEFEDRPNLVQVVLGEAAGDLVTGQPVMLLEVNVDDATGEQLADAVTTLLAAGAHDAWITPIVMKKGRPAHTVSLLVDTAVAGDLAQELTRTTGSLGVRGRVLERWPQRRLETRVDIDGLPVRIKVGAGRVKVEHDDAVRVARHTGRPVRDVISLAEERWRHRGVRPDSWEADSPRSGPPEAGGGQEGDGGDDDRAS